MANVHDVAVCVLRGKKMSAMKLQKLVYYSQAWSLAWDGKPLFPEEIQAWAHGPVVRELYEDHKGKYMVSPDDFPSGNPAKLDADQLETIETVLSSYGQMSAAQLSELTHAEAPWRHARTGLEDGAPGSWAISHDSMRSYYSSLSTSGEGVDNVADVNFPAWAR
jgi:uncharacterized phage-associated protein